MLVMEGHIILALIVFRIYVASADCDTLPHIDNTEEVKIGPGPYASGTVVKFECKPGYNPAGSSFEYRCSGNTWVDGELRCEQIFCRYIAPPDNGRIVNTPTNEAGTSISFECNEGYDQVGPGNMLCRADGYWSPLEPPVCQIKMCGDFGSVQHATTFQDSSDRVKNGYGSIVEITCDSNYVINGSPTVTCQSDGFWGKKPTCEVSTCPPYKGLNSSCIKKTQLSGAFLFFLCRDDVPVTVKGPDAAECIRGKWDNTNMACYCHCKVEADLKLVTLNNVVDGYLTHEDTLKWSCKKDSVKVTTNALVCNDGNIIKPVCKSTVTPTVTVTYKPVTDENGSTVNPPPTTTLSSEEGSGELVGGIVGGVIGAIILIALIVFGVYKLKKSGSNPGSQSEKKAMFKNGNGSEQTAEKEKVKLADSTEGEAV